MNTPPLVFTHLHKCAGSSLRYMLFHKLAPIMGTQRMHVPGITRSAYSLPMMEKRGEPLPTKLLLLADHSPCGVYDSRVLAPGRPFKVILLRCPLDRLESLIHFCAQNSFIPDKWSKYGSDLPSMPRLEFTAMCRHFAALFSYVDWLAPRTRNPRAARRNLLAYDVLARHDDLQGFCQRFNAHNPHGARFASDEILHVNNTPRASKMSATQREIAREILADDLAIWHDPLVQRAMSG